MAKLGGHDEATIVEQRHSKGTIAVQRDGGNKGTMTEQDDDDRREGG